MRVRAPFPPFLVCRVPASLNTEPLVVQIIGAADERDLYTSAAQSFRMFEENVYAKAVRMSDRARSRGDEPCKEGASRPGSLYHPQMRLPAETVSSAMVKEMQGDNLIEFERLEAAVDR